MSERPTTKHEVCTSASVPTYCHLQGVRFDARPCTTRCELIAEEPRARVEEPGPVHDEECAEQITYGGCCKHYCPTGEHETE